MFGCGSVSFHFFKGCCQFRQFGQGLFILWFCRFCLLVFWKSYGFLLVDGFLFLGYLGWFCNSVLIMKFTSYCSLVVFIAKFQCMVSLLFLGGFGIWFYWQLVFHDDGHLDTTSPSLLALILLIFPVFLFWFYGFIFTGIISDVVCMCLAIELVFLGLLGIFGCYISCILKYVVELFGYYCIIVRLYHLEPFVRCFSIFCVILFSMWRCYLVVVVVAAAVGIVMT